MTPVTFVLLGILFVWLVTTGRANKMLAAIMNQPGQGPGAPAPRVQGG